MENSTKFSCVTKLLLALIIIATTFLNFAEAGAVAYSHRDTTLDELKSIDSYVASALPVLRDGFFIGTSSGPVLVKSDPHPGATAKQPVVTKGYYNKLPRLIPAGFEGIAVSYFNLGAASPVLPPPSPKTYLGVGTGVSVPVAQPHPYISAASQIQNVQPSENQVYVTQGHQPQYQHQYIQEAEQSYQQQPQIQRYYSETESEHSQQQQPQIQRYYSETEPEVEHSQQQQYVAEAQQPQQYVAQPDHDNQQSEQQQPIQFQQFHREYVYPAQQPQFAPQQPADSQFAAQQAPQITARRHSSELTLASAPSTQASFQDDNLLRQDNSVESYQTQQFGVERFQSQKLFPNAEVLANSQFEETLPELLRNRFYKNANLASILAQESLPVQGEKIIGGDWDTNKITKGKIHALLSGAGLI